jgi:hypothetical protein
MRWPSTARVTLVIAAILVAVPSSPRGPRVDEVEALIGIDGRTGEQAFRATTSGPAALTVVAATKETVVAERRGCFSADLPGG